MASIKTSAIRLFQLLLLLVVFHFNLSAQGIGPDGLTLTMKAGFFDNVNARSGGARGYELNLREKNLSYSIDYLVFRENVFSKSVREHYEQVGLMFGSYTDFKEDKVRYTYQAGLSALWGIERGELISRRNLSGYDGKPSSRYYSTYEAEKFTTVGLLLKVDAQYMVTRWISFGASLAANVNPKKVMYMPMLNLQIGMIRERYRNPK